MTVFHLFAPLLFIAVCACGAGPSPEDICRISPDLPTCSCDDANPCTVDTRGVDGCLHQAVVYGEACIDAPGFCDVGAVCLERCEPVPCFDSHVEPPYGCVYTVRRNGWTCTDAGEHGVCHDGLCERSSTTP